MRVRRPSKHELACGEEDGAEHHGRETGLGDGAVVRRVVGAVVEELVIGVDYAAEDGAEEDGEEGESGGHGGPVSQLAEDDGDAAELHVQDAVAEGRVERDEEADGCKEELNGADEEFPTQREDADVPFFEFGVQRPVAGRVTEAPRFVDEELWGVGFIDED